MNSVNITTTNNFGDNHIKEYCGLVSSKIVVGANFFADFFASFTDVFGGRSGKYQSRLDEIYNDAIKELSKQAFRRGANGIVGLKMDFDEISGKDKSMFMVNAIGTAVKVDFNSASVFENQDSTNVSKDVLINAIKSHSIKIRIQADARISKEDFLVIAGNTEIAEALIEQALEFEKRGFSYSDEDIINFINSLEYGFACDIIYKLIPLNKYREKTIVSFIDKCNLFNAVKISEVMAAGNYLLVAELLSCHKDSYNKEDLAEMKQLLRLYNDMPECCTYEIVSSGLFKKTEEKVWVCKNGHKVPLDEDFCPECSINKKGIPSILAIAFNKFETKVKLLEDLLV